MVALGGRITSEIGVQGTATKWFNLFSKQLHDVQHIAEKVHGAKLHHGDDWHTTDSIKHWTYTIEGKVVTCYESIECVDEENKTITYKLFGEHIDPYFKNFKFIIQAIDQNSANNNNGDAIIKWSVEYESISDDVDPPFGYIELIHKNIKDFEHHLFIKA